MKSALQVGSLAAARGRKATGFLEVPGTSARMPLTLVNGVKEGPTLLITAGIHGGEYASIEATICIAAALDAGEVSGRIILMPLVSPEAFHARVQYVPPADGKNVNRQFPGNALGTASERIAHTVVSQAASQADNWIDLPGGDIHEALVPVVGYKDYFGNPVAEYKAAADGMVLLLATSLAMNVGDPLFGLGIA